MASSNLKARLRALPSVEEILESPEAKALGGALPRSLVADAAREVLDEIRRSVLDANGTDPLPDDIPARVGRRARALLDPSLRRVINASGVVIHTNLGRSALADDAVAAVIEAARGYSTLEYDIEHMQRGSRHAHCERLICALTGAEAAIAVNNNAAAVMLVFSEFTAGREAIVSRGELVEIGGSFRIPDIMELSGARMVEVGTTNKTHPRDYERAITNDTAMLLKVHTSNYRLLGFTESVSARELRRIADAAGHDRKARSVEGERQKHQADKAAADEEGHILVYEDLGSGALLGSEHLGEHAEPTVGEALSSGCDLVSFSGDKLLGGPQAGIVVGKKKLIDRLKSNPLSRALRLDKMTIAALETTLRLYLDPDRACAEIPTLRMLASSSDDVRTRAEDLAQRIEKAIPAGCASIEVAPEISRAGGGALPMHDIDTFVVRVAPTCGSAQACEAFLVKQNPVPIVARIRQEALLFDARTLLSDDELDEIARALAAYFSQSQT